jgi:PEP-CTERM motif
MRTLRNTTWILTVILGSFAAAPVVRADIINGPAMAGLVLNNTIPDGDLYALSLFAGTSTDVLKTRATDTYDPTVPSGGFTETMSGTYAGQALSVTYTGNTTAFPGGAATWTSTGTYGALNWMGSGSALFTFPTASTVQIAYTSTLSLLNGVNPVFTVSNSSTISGTDISNWLWYTGTTGTLTVNGIPMAAPAFTQGTFLSPIVGELGYDDYEVKGRITITSLYEICDEEDTGLPYNTPTLIKSAGTINLVPEPSSLVLAGIGTLGVLVGYTSRRVRRIGSAWRKPDA